MIDKITLYDLLNHLLVGIGFVYILNFYTSFNLIQEDITIGIFIYYLVGLFVGRIASVFIEPVLKKLGVIKFKKYKNFLKGEKSEKGEKIKMLSLYNNLYRNILTLLLLVLILMVFEHFFKTIGTMEYIGLLLFGIILFLLAHRKQTLYISNHL